MTPSRMSSLKASITQSRTRLIGFIIAVIVIFGCGGCFAFAMVDVTLREIGLLPTYTPSPTRTGTPTALPSSTPALTPTPTHTPIALPSNTPTPKRILTPSVTPTARPPTSTPIPGPRVSIIRVNKDAEYVDLLNAGTEAQDLSGWKLVSETGNQSCTLAGTIDASAELRVWASNSESGGYNCNFGDSIWNNDESDPALLYNELGEEVSRYP